MAHPNSILIVGIGNEFRSDDGVGLFVAEHLRVIFGSLFKIIAGIRDGAALVQELRMAEIAYLIDASQSGVSAGSIRRFEVTGEALPAEIFTPFSTHSINLAEAIELGRNLNCLPGTLIVYAIEGKNFSESVCLSSEVEKAAYEVVNQIRADLADRAGHPSNI